MPDLRTALESAINEAETPTPEAPPEAPQVEEAAPPAEAPDLEQASKVEETEPAKEEAAPEEAKPDVEKTQPTGEEKPKAQEEAQPQGKQHRIDRAPQSWKKEAKGEWAAIPLNVRQEIHRREMEINRVLEETKPARQFAEQFSKVVTPFQARIQAIGLPPMQVVQNLLNAEMKLATLPRAERARTMAELIQQYDVDIQALDDALSAGMRQQSQPQQQQSPDIAALVQQQVQQAIAPIFQQQQAARQQQVMHTIETMSLDPKYPHFDEVRNDMADIIELKAKQGIDLSLEDAYAMAVKLNPEVSAQLGRQNTMQTANQQHQQAQRARAAASSVSGSPAAGGNANFVGDGSLRGAIEAAFGGARV